MRVSPCIQRLFCETPVCDSMPEILKDELMEKLDEVLETLTEREEKVLRLRFGLDDGYARTLQEIGSIFNLTKTRIAQIEKKALRRMRHPQRIREIKCFVGWSLPT